MEIDTMASLLTGGFHFQETLNAFRLSKMRLLSGLRIKIEQTYMKKLISLVRLFAEFLLYSYALL